MLTTTNVIDTYNGNDSRTTFAITFQFQDNDQITVIKTDVLNDIDTTLIVGGDYTITGGNPGTAVEMTVALPTDFQINIYRVTDKTQDFFDALNNSNFLSEELESAIDRLTMMLQELENGIAGTTLPSAGGFFVAADQDVVDAAEITVNTVYPRQICRVTGDSSLPAVATLPDGLTDGQELRLVGGDDTATVTIDEAANVTLTGAVTLKANSVIDLFWSVSKTKWIESSRSL